MQIPLMKRHAFNYAKPMVKVHGNDSWIQWEECDLTGFPPERENVSFHSHGTIPKGQWDNLPEYFTATDGKQYKVEDIHSLTGDME